MRLIDADKLKTYLSKYLDYGHAISWVDAQPTAYSVDKVVSEIRRGSGNGYRDIDGDYVPPMIETKKAIEIVKQGGVSDDVCQWMIFDNSIEDDDHIWTYETGCKNYIEEEHTLHFDYCPYCGKKIKVVE